MDKDGYGIIRIVSFDLLFAFECLSLMGWLSQNPIFT